MFLSVNQNEDKIRSETAGALCVLCSYCGESAMLTANHPEEEVLMITGKCHSHRMTKSDEEEEQVPQRPQKKRKQGSEARQLSIMYFFPLLGKPAIKNS